MLHWLFQRHHMTPCVALGKASAGDPLCQGCRTFIAVSMRIQLEAEQEAHDRAARRG